MSAPLFKPALVPRLPPPNIALPDCKQANELLNPQRSPSLCGKYIQHSSETDGIGAKCV